MWYYSAKYIFAILTEKRFFITSFSLFKYLSSICYVFFLSLSFHVRDNEAIDKRSSCTKWKPPYNIEKTPLSTWVTFRRGKLYDRSQKFLNDLSLPLKLNSKIFLKFYRGVSSRVLKLCTFSSNVERNEFVFRSIASSFTNQFFLPSLLYT